MTVNELMSKLKELQNKDLGEFKIILSSIKQAPILWEFFSLSDIGYSGEVVIINIDED